MIDAMFQAGTDAALNDQVARPRLTQPAAPGFSFMDLVKSPFQGAGSGLVSTLAFGAEITGAFGDVLGAYPEAVGYTPTGDARRQANEARDKLLKQGPSFSNPAGDLLRGVARDTMPDAATTHASAQVVAGLFEFGSKAAGYMTAAGPLAGAALLGGDVGLGEADRLKQQGVDLATRTKAGAAAGVLAGGSVLIPMSGATALVRGAKGVLAGEVGTVGTAAAEKLILQHAGYDKLADTFDPLDPVGLALGLIPGALGAKFGRPKPLLKQAEVREALQLTPAEQARSDAFERSAGNLAELEAAIKAEKNPADRVILEAELTKQRAAAAGDVARAAVDAHPELEAAARVRQTADALDASRLTPDFDLPGRDAHLSAVEMAAEQLARGGRVEVADVLRPATAGDAVPFDMAFLHDDFNINPEALAYKMKTVDAVQAAQHLVGPERFEQIAAERLSRAEQGAGRETASAAQIEMAARKVVDFYARNPDAQVRALPGAPIRLTAAADQLRAARQPQESTRAPKPTEAANPEASAPARSAGGAEPAAPAAAARGPAADAQAPGVSLAAQRVAEINPDMLVHMDGMAEPVRAGDLLARVREEAAADVLDSRLLQVAAECAIRSA